MNGAKRLHAVLKSLHGGYGWFTYQLSKVFMGKSESRTVYWSRLCADFFVLGSINYFIIIYHISIIWYICAIKLMKYGESYSCSSDASHRGYEA
jgi:hypothetical protein